VLQTANSNSYETIRDVAILQTIQASLPESVTPSVSGFVAKYGVNYVSNEDEALNNINQALALNGGNPLLYFFRASIRQKLGDFTNAQQDIETALRLGSENWGVALILQANNLFFTGDPAGAVAAMGKVIESNTGDWWSYNVRGSDYLLLGDLSSARADFASAIALEPPANFPYVYSSLISMHEGRLDDAKKFLVQALQISPDPTYGEKIISAYIGTNVDYPNLDALSAYGRLTLGQYSEALAIADRGVQVFPFADLYFIKGAAECNLKQYKEAEDSYTQGLTLDPEFALLYLLRADVRGRQGNLTGAQSDLTALQSTKQFPLFAPYLQNAQPGSFTCDALFATSP
jgi:tetratricopeptide (TPR) repeat protein